MIKDRAFLHQIGDYASAKGILKDEAIKVFEISIREALVASGYSLRNPVIKIDTKSGEIKAFESFKIVSTVSDSKGEITIEQAQQMKSDLSSEKSSDILISDDATTLSVGSEFLRPFEMPEMNRLMLKKVMSSLSRCSNYFAKERQYETFRNRVGELVSVFVKTVEFGNAIVTLGDGEAILAKEDMLLAERPAYRPNTSRENDANFEKRIDRGTFRAIISNVIRRDVGWQVMLSRTSNDFLKALLRSEITEIGEGVIKIQAIARFPGEKAKVAVFSTDASVDAVGSCVGVKGMRINLISKECKGERIDIVQWSGDLATFVVNAMSPADVIKVILHENNRVEVIVPDEQVKIAVGVRGYNVRLASKLTGCEIVLMSESDHSLKQATYIEKTSELFMDALQTDIIMSKFLVLEGFGSFSDIINSDVEELASLDGFDRDLAIELKKRANDYVTKKCTEWKADSEKPLQDELIALIANKDVLLAIAGHATQPIRTVTDLADLSRDEFLDYVKSVQFTSEEADDIILQARRSLKWIH
jgi:N utilization substance protein A